MKLNYEKVRRMSLDLQEKEDARDEIVKRIKQTSGTGDTPKSSAANRKPFIKLEASKHVLYASAFVYGSVVISVASTIYKVYMNSC